MFEEMLKIRASDTQTIEPEVAEPQIFEPEVLPDVDDGNTGGQGDGYRVILYNCDCHNMDEVIGQVIKATGCTPSRAASITMEAHFKGRAVCFKGERGKCQDVCKVLREIRLQCEVDCD